MKNVFFILVTFLMLLLAQQHASASATGPQKDSLISRDTIADTLVIVQPDRIASAAQESFRKKKLITCVLAFPLPFGFVGLHRIYLGTEPWVPIVYLCTAGGGFGLLPLIDFLYLVTANEEEFRKYENNPKVFMFVE